MPKSYQKSFIVISLIVIGAVVVSWLLVPAWRSQPGGFILLLIAALVGVVATLARLKDAVRLLGDLFGSPAEEDSPTKARLDQLERLVIQMIAAPLPKGYEHEKSKIRHNLPAPNYSEFVGREETIQQIVRTLRPYPHSQYPIVTIEGVGGVGKSALALEIAHRYLYNHDQLPPEERFEAIVWASAKETLLTAEGIIHRPAVSRTLADIYAVIAATLQREEITRASKEEDQSELIRHALTLQRTLLIIDNLETIEDEKVVSFIIEVPAPTKVITTSRQRRSVAYPVRLTGLPWKDAQKIIQQECHKKGISLNEQDAFRLFEKTNGIPLAIVWSVALMSLGYAWETIFAKLTDPEDDLAVFLFKGIVASIHDTPAYRLLLSLSLFANDASREAIGEVARLGDRARDNGLVQLEVLSLANYKGECYSLLPITRAYALAEMKRQPVLEVELSRSWISYLKTISSGVDSEYYWRFRSHAFYRDGDTILEAIRWCRQNGPAEDAIFLTYAASDFLEVAGRWRENLLLVEEMLVLAESIRDELSVARLNNVKGWVLMQQGNLDGAEECFQKSLEYYRSKNLLDGQAIVLQHLSAIYRKRERFEDAEGYCQQAESIAAQLGIGDLVALIKVEHGKLARDQQHWEEAGRYFSEISEYFEKRVEQSPRDEPLARSTWGHLSVIAYHQGRFQEAKELALKSLEYFELYGTKGFMATLKYRLALAEEGLGELEAARTHVKEALDWFDRLGMKPDHKQAMILLSRLSGV